MHVKGVSFISQGALQCVQVQAVMRCKSVSHALHTSASSGGTELVFGTVLGTEQCLQAGCPHALLAGALPCKWATGMVPLAAILSWCLGQPLSASVSCFLITASLRFLPLYAAIPSVLLCLFFHVALCATLLSRRKQQQHNKSKRKRQMAAESSFSNLHHVPEGADATVKTILTASNYYEVR
jgi:hypothetical protein